MNKRKKKRYTGNVHVEVKGVKDGKIASGVAVNLGHQGVGICGTTPLDPGMEVSITFNFEDEQGQKATEQISGVVRWNQKLGEYHASGIELSEEINGNDHFLILSQIELAKEFET